MTTRAQLAILALLIILAILAFFFPRSAASDVPAAASRIPASEFEPVGSAGSLSGLSTPGAPLQSRTPDGNSASDVVLAPANEARTTPSPSAPRPVSVAPVSRHPVGRQSASSGVTPATGPTASSVAGTASWFRSPRGVSAAGPALRTALGPGWRGRQVSVCAGPACITVVLGDWCACSRRVIDLDDNQFARLAPLSRGVVEVSVRW